MTKNTFHTSFMQQHHCVTCTGFQYASRQYWLLIVIVLSQSCILLITSLCCHCHWVAIVTVLSLYCIAIVLSGFPLFCPCLVSDQSCFILSLSPHCHCVVIVLLLYCIAIIFLSLSHHCLVLSCPVLLLHNICRIICRDNLSLSIFYH